MGTFENKYLIRALLNKLLPKPSDDMLSLNNNVSDKPMHRKKKKHASKASGNRSERRARLRTKGKARKKQTARR